MISIDKRLNPIEVMLVAERLDQQGVTNYSLLPGNRCIWATYGRINEYYIFNDGKLIDIQID
jgi:hypothetical protein